MAYHGQVLEEDEDDAGGVGDDGDAGSSERGSQQPASAGGAGGQRGGARAAAPDSAASWMAHRLKFKRHVDDAYRAGDDGLVTIDDSAAAAGGYGGANGARDRPGGRERRAHGGSAGVLDGAGRW